MSGRNGVLKRKQAADTERSYGQVHALPAPFVRARATCQRGPIAINGAAQQTRIIRAMFDNRTPGIPTIT
jgi:hypothetical protein